MELNKSFLLCLVSILLLAGFIDSRPAPQDGGDEGKHVHKIRRNDGDGGTHVHHHRTGGDGGDGTHVHHYKVGGGSGGGGDTDVDVNAGGGGGGGSGGSSLDASTIEKIKKLIGKLNIDPNKIDFSKLDLSHKYDGKDSLQPSMCDDSINDRYGVGKHFVRGTRDVGFAIVSEAQAILDPLLGGITLGIGNGLKALLCALEDGFSDFGSDFDSATDIAKNGLVNFFKLQGPHPILGIPLGIAGIAGEAVKAAGSIAGDAVGGVENAVGQLVGAL